VGGLGDVGVAVAVRRALLDLRAAMGDDAEARRLARELLSLHPDDRRAQALASGGSPIEVSPADYAAYLREGLALGAAGKHLDSALAYRAALALEGDGEEALDGLGWTLGVLGFYREAIPVLERAIAVDPRSEQARAHLGWVKGKLP